MFSPLSNATHCREINAFKLIIELLMYLRQLLARVSLCFHAFDNFSESTGAYSARGSVVMANDPIRL